MNKYFAVLFTLIVLSIGPAGATKSWTSAVVPSQANTSLPTNFKRVPLTPEQEAAKQNLMQTPQTSLPQQRQVQLRVLPNKNIPQGTPAPAAAAASTAVPADLPSAVVKTPPPTRPATPPPATPPQSISTPLQAANDNTPPPQSTEPVPVVASQSSEAAPSIANPAEILKKLTEAVDWKIKVLNNEVLMKENEYSKLPEDMKVNLKELNLTDPTDLINWVYPKLIEAMLQLSSESYIKTKINISTQEFADDYNISLNLKDSYSLQRKIFEIDNKIQSLVSLKDYIGAYRAQMINLLVGHIRITNDLESILGINKSTPGASVQLSLKNNPADNMASKLKKDDKEEKSDSIGMGKLNVNDTGPQVIDLIIKNAPNIFPFKEYFGDNISIRSIPDLMTYLSRLEAQLSDEITFAQRERSDLDDPNMRIAYGITGKLALEGFEPQAILYRNDDKDDKEFSGTLFYRDSKNPEKCGISLYPNIQKNLNQFEESSAVAKNPKDYLNLNNAKPDSSERANVIRDVFVLSYSGSKSNADWGKNFKVFSDEVSRKNPLLWGYKVHEGIAQAFEQGYNDLGSRIGELMLKYKRQTLKYLNTCPNTRVELYIITTGHSLGGGLSTLSTIAMKKMAELYNNIDGLKVYVSNISFAAPPVFRNDAQTRLSLTSVTGKHDWAERAEKFVGKGNVLRVFVDRDPVATISPLRAKPSSLTPSFLMTLLKYKHIGIPLMMQDVGGYIEDISLTSAKSRAYWKPHLIARYGLLVSLFANDFMNVREYINGFEDRSQLAALRAQIGELESVKQRVKKLTEYLRAANNQSKNPEIASELEKILTDNSTYLAQYEETSGTVKFIDKEDLTVEDVDLSNNSPDYEVKLGRAQTDTLEYTPYIPDEKGDNIISNGSILTLSGSKTCDPNTYWKENIEKSFTLKSGNRATEENKLLASCGCCLLKNLILTQGRVSTKVREILGKKIKIDTIEKAKAYCVTKGYCTTDAIDRHFAKTTTPNDFKTITEWTKKFEGNVKDIWRAKQLNAK